VTEEDQERSQIANDWLDGQVIDCEGPDGNLYSEDVALAAFDAGFYDGVKFANERYDDAKVLLLAGIINSGQDNELADILYKHFARRA